MSRHEKRGTGHLDRWLIEPDWAYAQFYRQSDRTETKRTDPKRTGELSPSTLGTPCPLQGASQRSASALTASRGDASFASLPGGRSYGSSRRGRAGEEHCSRARRYATATIAPFGRLQADLVLVNARDDAAQPMTAPGEGATVSIAVTRSSTCSRVSCSAARPTPPLSVPWRPGMRSSCWP